MTTDDTTAKVPWEAPASVALTDADSRSDEYDVAQQNGGSPIASGTS